MLGVQDQNTGVNLQRRINQERAERGWEGSAVEHLPGIREEDPGLNPIVNNTYISTKKEAKNGKKKLWAKEERGT